MYALSRQLSSAVLSVAVVWYLVNRTRVLFVSPTNFRRSNQQHRLSQFFHAIQICRCSKQCTDEGNGSCALRWLPRMDRSRDELKRAVALSWEGLYQSGHGRTHHLPVRGSGHAERQDPAPAPACAWGLNKTIRRGQHPDRALRCNISLQPPRGIKLRADGAFS